MILGFFFSVLFFYFFRFKWQSLYVTKAALEFTLYPRLASNLWSPPALAHEVMQELPAKVPSGRDYKLEPWLYSGLLSHMHLSARWWVCCSGCAVLAHEGICVPPAAVQTQRPQRGDFYLASLLKVVPGNHQMLCLDAILGIFFNIIGTIWWATF